MRKACPPEEIAEALLSRSACAVQVAAVCADSWGVFAWGWNSSGPHGTGEHAEAHAIRRGNRRRFPFATIYVAARRRRSGRPVLAKPCEECAALLKKFKSVRYRDESGAWRVL